MLDDASRRELRAIVVHQWLPTWDRVTWNPSEHRRRPQPQFYLFTLTAPDLLALTGIYRRSTAGGKPRSKDLGIQRRHDPERSDKIREFVHYGYPWSELSTSRRNSEEFNDLRKPGWLPTAIIVNFLTEDDTRDDSQVASHDLIEIEDTSDREARIRLPRSFTGVGWKPQELSPIEVIDGQHRLWAFTRTESTRKFELPVVAFRGLDISWQAYLFWTINIKPKRINPSLAFDLYPLLRTEDWLERFVGHQVYRETRAQELTEALWSHPESPWFHRINMLGDPKEGTVTQAAWVRSLLATYVRGWEGRRIRVGGLFGAPAGKDKTVLPWSRAQQAAFLIVVWQEVRDSVRASSERWASALRAGSPTPMNGLDPSFAGEYSLLNTDQGVRGILHVSNDLCYVRVDELKLSRWKEMTDSSAIDRQAVEVEMRSLKSQNVAGFLSATGKAITSFDWRTSAAPGLSDEERTSRLGFRGGSGYRELRRQLIKHLCGGSGEVASAARKVQSLIG